MECSLVARARTVFFCQHCGQESPKWLGRCPGCGEWNSFVEEKVAPAATAGIGDRKARTPGERPIPLNEVEGADAPRLPTGLTELDRVLGGGLVPGSLALVGGDPGIGKSTLLLQLSQAIAERVGTALYVSGEESARQIRLRGDRLGAAAPRLLVLAETDLQAIEEQVDAVKPTLVVVDSIQTIYHPDLTSAPGSVGQVRECAARLLRLAKATGTAVVLVGHVTKESAIAGPRILEHLVDAVLYFEGDRHQSYRILRAVKNRFGSTNELGLFEMREQGLVEVPNASQAFLAERPTGVAGSVVVASLEGTRPILVEVQALVTPTVFGMARRTATGIDYNRVLLLLAVLEKRCGLALGSQDAYLKVAGGARVDEPALDLGVAVALASSFREVPTDPRTVVIGEVGLAGEVRSVGQLDRRIAEASRLGFARCVVPRGSVEAWRRAGGRADLEVVGVATVEEGLQAALQGLQP